jgi:4a-hydroxytetrahydrobiopterin dehydratase
MPALSDAAIAQALTNMPGWSYEDGEITRQFRFKDFVEAFGFISQVATVQEQMNHHATIINTWAHVTIKLSTHDEGGITEKDFELATKISERSTQASQ